MTNLDQEIYFVKQDYGKAGQETQINYQRCSKADVMSDLSCGNYTDVLSVGYFNLAEGHCRDVTEDFARECFLAELPKAERASDFSEFVMTFYPEYEREFLIEARRAAPALVRSRTNPYGAQTTVEAAE